MKVGVAGLGRMGAAIAKRLIEVGHEVAVWNRNASKTEPLAKLGAAGGPGPAAPSGPAAGATSPSDLASRADVLITILTDAKAIADVYEGASGLLAGNVSGKTFIEMSTVQPETEVALAKKIAAKGATMLECPV